MLKAISSIFQKFQSSDVPMLIDAENVTNESFIQVFHRLDKKSLLNCTLACHRFADLISNDSFWIEHARMHNKQKVLPPLPWRRAVAQKKFDVNESEEVDVSNFNFNMKKMVLGGRGYSPIIPSFHSHFETARENTIRGVIRSDDFSIRASADGIRMELNGGEGCQPHPEVSQCFAYSFSTSAISIFIDLVDSGIDEWILDYVRPKIRITQKINHRHDCSARIAFAAQLNYNETQWIHEFGMRQTAGNTDNKRYKSIVKEWEQWTEDKWEDVSLEFTDYPSGMRHLTVLNEGKDGMFWKGFYGPKVANIQVQVILPDIPIVRAAAADQEKCQEDEEPSEADEPRPGFRMPLHPRRRYMWAVPPAVAREADDNE
ncbi:unnamed protein product [Caenorhabditis brenneri]